MGGLTGAICITDDAIINGSSTTEHDNNLKFSLKRCKQVGIKLNHGMTVTNVYSVTFMGHQISAHGMRPDPAKLSAINEMNAPELRRFLGMTNYLARFLSLKATMLEPLNNLMKQHVPWNWSSTQQGAFEAAKLCITFAPVLAFYNPGQKCDFAKVKVIGQNKWYHQIP